MTIEVNLWHLVDKFQDTKFLEKLFGDDASRRFVGGIIALQQRIDLLVLRRHNPGKHHHYNI